MTKFNFNGNEKQASGLEKINDFGNKILNPKS